MALVRRNVCAPIDAAADAERCFGPGYEFVAGSKPRIYQFHKKLDPEEFEALSKIVAGKGAGSRCTVSNLLLVVYYAL